MDRIINITHHTYFPDNDDLLKHLKSDEFKYEFIPAVIYTEKASDKDGLLPKLELPPNSFSLYEAGTSISLLKGYFGTDFKKDELVLVKKAFQTLKNFASPCSERVIADLCCQIILRTIENAQHEEIIFFIEKSATDKMLGRLGSLYLDLTRTIICFLSYEPDDLMTTIMSNQTGKLHFDIHRLMLSESYGEFGPYPGSSEDAIKQTYFYKPIPIEPAVNFLPIRLDIFAQGLSESDIEEKSGKIVNIFKDTKEVLPYSFGKNYVLLPIGFERAKMAWKEKLYEKESIKKLIS